MPQGRAALTNLVRRLVTSISNGDTPNTRDVLNHVIDSEALLENADWKLNMKKRELIKPNPNPPFTRLCPEEIKITLKLFGHDLSKHMKNMSEATKVSKQMQKHSQDNRARADDFVHMSESELTITNQEDDTAFFRQGPVSKTFFLAKNRCTNNGSQ